MKLSEVQKDDSKPGTYAGVRFGPKTKESIIKFIKDNKINNPVDTDELHTTLLYSSKHLPNYKAIGEYDIPMTGTPDGFECWDSHDGSKKILVMKYTCSALYQRHHKLMAEHGASYDFDQYVPHISLSYNFSGDIKKLPTFDGVIDIVSEYQEVLGD